MSDSDYEVGYRRPPRHTQFKPGQSGNPKGRPKQRKSLAALLKDTLYEMVTVKVNGRPCRMPRIHAMVHTVVNKAIAGDAKARRDLLELVKRYPATVSHREPIRMIDSTMSAKEAADAYAATLRAIPGLIDPDEELDLSGEC